MKSVNKSVNDSVWNTVDSSVWKSFREYRFAASVSDSVRTSVNKSVYHGVSESVYDSVRRIVNAQAVKAHWILVSNNKA